MNYHTTEQKENKMKKTWYEVGVSYKNGETESLESRESLANAIDLANSITLDMKQADYLFVDKWACTDGLNNVKDDKFDCVIIKKEK